MAAPEVTRRGFLGLSAGLGLAAVGARLDQRVGPLLVRAGDEPGLVAPPFRLGVASGDPLPNGVVLWTRLAPDPLAPGGGMQQQPVGVQWEVATDERFRRIVRDGTATARPDAAHSVHVDVRGLDSAHDYFYRFRVGDYESDVGRTRTAPEEGSDPSRLRFAFGSCQDYQKGYFGAHRHLAAEEDLAAVLWLGDYIYESGPNPAAVRQHEGPEPLDLEAYRRRYATYKGDAELQLAHAAHPWVVTWDDHEVDNNYADDHAERDQQTPEAFLARRAAAYRAWWEHQPVRLPAPSGPDFTIYRRLSFGDLATFHVLDTRQYRTDQPCDSTVDIGAPCPAVDDPSATLLGAEQREWLFDGLRDSRARWDVVAQQVMVGPVNFTGDPSNPIVDLDDWDAYRVERGELLKALAELPRNGAVITGDIHASWVHDLQADDRTVATELVGTSVTSSFPLHDFVQNAVTSQPTVRYFDGSRHGYVVNEITPKELRADFVYVTSIETPDTPSEIGASFVIEDRRPGAQEA